MFTPNTAPPRLLNPADALRTGSLLLAGIVGLVSEPPATLAQPEPAEIKVEGGRIVELRRYEVKGTVVGSLGVQFTVKGEEADDPLAPILSATVADVIPGGAGARAGFKAGDELIAMNGHSLRGLTIVEFTRLVSSERMHGDLTWSLNRDVAGPSLSLVLNGIPKARAWVPIEAPRPPERPTAQRKSGRTAATPDPDHVETMDPYQVEGFWSGAIEVHFSLSGTNLNDNLNDPILDAYIVDVQGDRVGAWSFLLRGDFLTGLNGKPIKGLTVRQLGALVAAERKKGDLVWEVRRGVMTFTRKFNGRWIRPLPTP